MNRVGYFKYCQWEVIYEVSEDETAARILSRDVYPDQPERDFVHKDVAFDGPNIIGRSRRDFEDTVADAINRFSRSMVTGFIQQGYGDIGWSPRSGLASS